ncbi:hypothetical protein KR51_00032920 [Rubidibacter lacunae KORDI 51-2]|uniref:Macrocin-O-methyltransferase (TylF) n=1 Tax=Rubidibacter lacunae KORDI 51-2 TaxID=582515 RepID=U5D6Q3_9CHRO|nr:TylF/MycF/NovP-related O-methyltransferase [Rubidibacter lacunae]ERN40343.1 hypothetical protein KR51_00032920 [Rubidibacter lacunae KORDI 51-2]
MWQGFSKLVPASLKQQFVSRVKQIARRVVIDEVLKNRTNQELLSARLESLSLETELFGSSATRCRDRFELLELAVDYARDKLGDGLYAEFGVSKGASINLLAKRIPGKTIFGFDSFEGLPEFWKRGSYSGIEAQSEIFGKDVNMDVEDNVKLVKGWFNETVPGFLELHPEPVVFCHMDSDLYSSAKYLFDTLLFAQTAIIVFDEYFNYPDWREHEYKAFQEYLATHPNVSAWCLGYCPAFEQAAFVLTAA